MSYKPCIQRTVDNQEFQAMTGTLKGVKYFEYEEKMIGLGLNKLKTVKVMGVENGKKIKVFSGTQFPSSKGDGAWQVRYVENLYS